MTPTYVSRLNPFSIRFPLPIRDKNFKASFFFFFFFLHYLISQDRRNIIIVRRRSSINNSTDEIHPRLITFVHFALARHLADKAKNKRVCKSEKLFQRNSLFLFLFFFFFFSSLFHHLFPVPVAEEKPFATVSFFSLMIPRLSCFLSVRGEERGGKCSTSWFVTVEKLIFDVSPCGREPDITGRGTRFASSILGINIVRLISRRISKVVDQPEQVIIRGDEGNEIALRYKIRICDVDFLEHLKI